MNKMLWIGSSGLGDILCATPMLRKLYSIYDEKISICTYRPLVFKNSPYVDKIYNLRDSDHQDVLNNYLVHKTFNASIKVNDVELKHNLMHIVQYHATSLGFNLIDEECSIDFYAGEYKNINDIPEEYVVVHPSSTWPSRTWRPDSWQNLINQLNKDNIFVVVIGRDEEECSDGMPESKVVHDLEVDYGINLTNKTDLSQTWHLINNSKCIVTMDSGILHLSGSTDSHIIQMGSSINPKYRAPYRNGTQQYKYDYVLGKCNSFCACDMRYGIKEHGSIHGIPPLMGCLEERESFDCHPSSNQVYDKIKEIMHISDSIVLDVVKKYDEINLLDPMAWQTVHGRISSFDYVFKILKNKKRPIRILETGCMRGANLNEAFFDGSSTFLFANFVKNYTGGHVVTIDNSDGNLQNCKELTKDYSDVIDYCHSDSVSYLKNMSDEEVGKIDLFYLDSYDLNFSNPLPSMEHHVNEVLSIIKRLSNDAIIMIDDNWLSGTLLFNGKTVLTENIGKGELAKEVLVKNGWKMEKEPIVGLVNQYIFIKEKEKPKQKIMYVAPHLSTGGMPEVLRKRIDLLKEVFDIYVVEFTFYGPSFVVQRNEIIKMVGDDKFFSLGGLNEDPDTYLKNRMRLMDLIGSIKPFVVHIEETPARFFYGGFPDKVAERLYSDDREYVIFESSHDASYDPNNGKKWFPDKFLFVSKWHMETYKDIDIPKSVVEYPIEIKERPNREDALVSLGLDPDFKHVLNVGLFTPNKNQKEIVEFAKVMSEEKVIFHFVGNMANNFKSYWGEFIKEKPENCIFWGERKDVDKFYGCMDLFLFTSIYELNPICLKEALGWRMDVLMRNLREYCGVYDGSNSVEYLDSDYKNNISKIRKILKKERA